MYFRVLISVCFVLTVESGVAPTHLLVTRVGPCDNGPQDLVSVTELSITTQLYDSALTGILNVSKDVSNGWKIKVTMQKCLDLRNQDSCDHFKSFFVVSNGCNDEDNEEQDIYTMVFHYISPKLTCPIQAGVYKIVDYPFFTEDNYVAVHESKISTSIFGYIYRLDGYSVHGDKILCLEAFLELLYIRVHYWKHKEVQPTTNNSHYTSKEATEKNILSREES